MSNKELSQEYLDYLRSAHWQDLREAVLHDERGRIKACVSCFSPDDIQAHHLIYRSLYDCVPSDLVPLCRECHEILHQAKDSGEFERLQLFREPPATRNLTIAKIIASAKQVRGYSFPSRQSTTEFNKIRLVPQKKSRKFMSYADYQRKIL